MYETPTALEEHGDGRDDHAGARHHATTPPRRHATDCGEHGIDRDEPGVDVDRVQGLVMVAGSGRRESGARRLERTPGIRADARREVPGVRVKTGRRVLKTGRRVLKIGTTSSRSRMSWS
ncbi:hypothetical protein ACIF80_17895 [Streptomyces sp. NPDC085927]|uniref:hypothetical protein n=1 Tax=Streptomyces sp. NPDC085927 TaxID=3365738 RepID=UPI0037CE3979